MPSRPTLTLLLAGLCTGRALAAAERLARLARTACQALDREVTVAIVDASGQTLLLSRGPAVGPHNLEAAGRHSARRRGAWPAAAVPKMTTPAPAPQPLH